MTRTSHPTYPAPSSPDVAEHLAAHPALLCSTLRHESLRGGEDRYPQAAHHPWQAPRVGVHAKSGSAHSAKAADDSLIPLTIPQVDAEDPLRVRFEDFEV